MNNGIKILLTTVIWVAALSLCSQAVAADKTLKRPQIESLLSHYAVPGAAIGIIKDGQIVMAEGFGVKSIETQEAVDSKTLFKIASNTKAFTSFALAQLVDDGKLKWKDTIVSHLQDFTLYDPYVTQHFNVVDLLTHRSGLGLGAGDLMLWPEPSSFTREEVIHNLRYLPKAGDFRADYAYDNLLYIVAGELVPAITKQSWEDFVEQRIFKPLSMQHCFANPVPESHRELRAKPHAQLKGSLQIIKRKTSENNPHVSAAAGGIECSVEDMLKWVAMHLNKGKLNNGQQLVSGQQHKHMWQPHTIMPLSSRSKKLDNSHFSAYGLGWRLHDVDGYLRVHHSGSLAGMYSAVTMFPELDLGIVVLTNQQSSQARNALVYSLMKPYLGDSETDWRNVFVRSSPRAKKVETTYWDTLPLLTLEKMNALGIHGKYLDPWFGEVEIKWSNGAAQIDSKRMVKLVGQLFYDHVKDRVVVRWQDRSLEADVFALFERKNDKVSSMKLMPIFDDIDFSYDFQDLHFTPIYNE